MKKNVDKKENMNLKPMKFFNKKITFFLWGLVFVFGGFTFFYFKKNNSKKAPETFVAEEISYKKGVGGPVLPKHIDELNISWFYSWGTTPYYSGSNLNDYDPKVWEKFVPMFSSWGSDPGEHRFDKHMEKICEKAKYCNKGNYYLIGNEPYQAGMDRPKFDKGGLDKTIVYMQGSIMKNILRYDSTAKFIVLGVRTPDSSGIAMAKGYLESWQKYWKSDSQLASFPDVVKGFHVHMYACNSVNTSVKNFGPSLKKIVKDNFGKEIENQEIWITEMGSPLNVNSPSIDSCKSTMDCHVNKYESYPYDQVTRYAWFYYGCSESVLGIKKCPGSHKTSRRTLADYSNLNNLTELGKKYANMPVSINPPPNYLKKNKPTSTPSPKPTLTPTLKPTPKPTFKPTPTPKSVVNKKEQECINSNGVWKQFGNSGVDSCSLILNKDLNYSSVLTMGCDCGLDKCWDGQKCVVNPTPAPTSTPMPIVTIPSSTSKSKLTIIPESEIICGCGLINNNDDLVTYECKGNDDKDHIFWFEYNGEKVSSDIRVKKDKIWRFTRPRVEELEVRCK